MKKLSVILCAIALIGLSVWAQARTVVVVGGGTPAAAAGASYTDNFNTDTSANWTAGSGFAGGGTIFGNAFVFSSSNYRASYYTGGAFNTSDNYSECIISADYGGGPAVRLSTSGSTAQGYFIRNEPNNFRIAKINGTTVTNLGSGWINESYTTSTVFRITASGSTITLYKDGTQKQQVTDSDYSSGGVGILHPGATYGIGASYDDWAGGDL